MSENRSQSRGREIYVASGRGGAGNIRSVSRDAAKTGPADFDDDANIPRGREIDVSSKVLSSGRGGAGNIRAPSKDRSPSVGLDAREREIIAKHIAQDEHTVHSSGRGGAGNIRDPSRSRSRPPNDSQSTIGSHPHIHSSGRGGAGNFTALGTDAAYLQAVEESEIAKFADANPHIHSSGRGGAGNLTSAPVPADAKDAGAPRSASRGPFSSGRGGAGNIHAAPAGEGEERGRGILGQAWDAVRTSTSRSRPPKDETS